MDNERECEITDLTSHKSTKNRSYTMEFKREAVKYAQDHSNRATAEKYRVDRQTIREWKRNIDAINSSKGYKKRLPGGGRKLTSDDVEERLIVWIHARRSKMLRVSRKMIMVKAKSYFDEGTQTAAGQAAFVASRGWLEKFMRRNNLSLRRRTTLAQKDPSFMIEKLLAYILHVRRILREHTYEPSCIIAMDETPVWKDMVSNTTVNTTGTSDVMMKTTGHEKCRVSVALSAEGDGTKLKPMIVFAGAKRESKALNTEFRNVCTVGSSVNGWMNEELTIRWVKETLGISSFQKRVLAWDTYEAHMMDSVKAELKKGNTTQGLVPGGALVIFRGRT